MDKSDEQFLWGIAKEVEKLLVNSEYRNVFEWYGLEFQRELDAYQKKASEQQELSTSDKTNPPFKLMTRMFRGVTPKNNKEDIEKSYRLLIIIHDWLLESCVPINKDIRTPSLAGLVGCLDFDLTSEEQIIIETALERVRADLTKPFPTKDEMKIKKPKIKPIESSQTDPFAATAEYMENWLKDQTPECITKEIMPGVIHKSWKRRYQFGLPKYPFQKRPYDMYKYQDIRCGVFFDSKIIEGEKPLHQNIRDTIMQAVALMVMVLPFFRSKYFCNENFIYQTLNL